MGCSASARTAPTSAALRCCACRPPAGRSSARRQNRSEDRRPVNLVRGQVRNRHGTVALGDRKTGAAMVKSEYYRRQADLCLQLARVQHDQKAAIRLMEFAEELMTKAEAAVQCRH